jgi:adenylate cyclase
MNKEINVGKEIERKFLVNSEKISKYIIPLVAGSIIRQGYVFDNEEKSMRIRIINNKGYITLKQNIDDSFSRWEFEYEIPFKDATEMLDIMCDSTLKKKRSYFSFDGKHTWEIDMFENENAGLIIAEIELDSENEKFDIPDFIEKEVTDDPRYLNINLIKYPYTTWNKGE